jgi:hypothetical protein
MNVKAVKNSESEAGNMAEQVAAVDWLIHCAATTERGKTV